MHLYGSTEAGYIFVGDAFHDNPQVIDGNAFVELVPWRRYFTGDAVRRTPTGYRILGRYWDLFLPPDGRVLSAFEIDEALAGNFACWHWCLVQVSEHRRGFQCVADPVAPDGLELNSPSRNSPRCWPRGTRRKNRTSCATSTPAAAHEAETQCGQIGAR